MKRKRRNRGYRIEEHIKYKNKELYSILKNLYLVDSIENLMKSDSYAPKGRRIHQSRWE